MMCTYPSVDGELLHDALLCGRSFGSVRVLDGSSLRKNRRGGDRACYRRENRPKRRRADGEHGKEEGRGGRGGEGAEEGREGGADGSGVDGSWERRRRTTSEIRREERKSKESQ